MPTFSRPRFAARLVAGSLLAAAMSLAFSGCGLIPAPRVDPTRHYVLAAPSVDALAPATARGSLTVGLRIVRVAPYLDGKAMIVRIGDNEIDYRDYARWAEPLSVGVGRVLQARLLAAERVGRVLPQPYPFDVARDVDVAVTVERAEGQVRADGVSTVSFRCLIELTRAIEGAGTGEVLVREVFNAPEVAWTEGDHAALARALGEAAASLAERVVALLPAE
jgi:ABC-type uncharacterized transport system auxiliary subunit